MTVKLERSPERSVTLGEISGVVTKAPDLTIACSAVVLAVDGVDRPLMCAEAPLWRAIDWGVSGDDVVALRSFLASVGYTVRTDQTRYDQGLENVVRKYRADFGISAGTAFDPSFVVYAPDQLALSKVTLAVGDRLAIGGSLGVVGGRVIRATLPAEPYSPDQRVVKYGDSINQVVRVNDTLWELVGDLRPYEKGVSASGSGQAADANSVGAITAFRTAFDAWAVPLTSIRADGQVHCVFLVDRDSHLTPRKVEIVEAIDAAVNITGLFPGDTVLSSESSAPATGCS